MIPCRVDVMCSFHNDLDWFNSFIQRMFISIYCVPSTMFHAVDMEFIVHL